MFKRAEFAMAQQDIRYYLNGMLLVIYDGTLQRSPPTAIGCRGPASTSGQLRAAGVILPRKTVLELGKLLADSDDR